MDGLTRKMWGSIAFLALLITIPFSWGILVERSSRESGGRSVERPALIAAISKRPILSFGFRKFLSDVAWLEAVQVAGNLKMTPADYDRLNTLLNVVADFDPEFEIPYLLGGLVLGDSPAHSREAIRILERGKAVHRYNWRFPFYIGYTLYFSLGDAEAAGKAMAEAAQLHDSPAYLAGLASRMLSEARAPETAMALLGTMARQEKDPVRRAALDRRVREVAVERDLQILERAVERYREKTGTIPGELGDLVRERLLASIPVEPNGGNYMLEVDGKVRSDRMARRLRVFRWQ